jgi:hypothetical protein
MASSSNGSTPSSIGGLWRTRNIRRSIGDRDDAKHRVAAGREDDSIRLRGLEEAHTTRDLLKERPEDRLALRLRQLDESHGFGVPATTQRGSPSGPHVVDPVGVGECRHDVSLPVQGDDRDRGAARRSARAPGGGEEILRTNP